MGRAKGEKVTLVRTNADNPFSIAYVECHSPETAQTLKEWFDAQYALRFYGFFWCANTIIG